MTNNNTHLIIGVVTVILIIISILVIVIQYGKEPVPTETETVSKPTGLFLWFDANDIINSKLFYDTGCNGVITPSSVDASGSVEIECWKDKVKGTTSLIKNKYVGGPHLTKLNKVYIASFYNEFNPKGTFNRSASSALSGGITLPSTQSLTIFVVMQHNNKENTFQSYLTLYDNGNNIKYYLANHNYSPYSTTGSNIFVMPEYPDSYDKQALFLFKREEKDSVSNPISVGVKPLSTLTSADNLTILCLTISNTTNKIYLNNEDITINLSSGDYAYKSTGDLNKPLSAVNYSADHILLGSIPFTSGIWTSSNKTFEIVNNCNIGIGEIIIYNVALSNEDRLFITKNLATKWSISV